MTPCHKQWNAGFPPLASRVHVSVTPCGFVVVETVLRGFSRGLFCFLLPQISFHHFYTHLICVNFIHPYDGASCVVIDILAIHKLSSIKELHRISSLDPGLSWTQVDFLLIFLFLSSTKGSGDAVVTYWTRIREVLSSNRGAD